MSEISTLGQLQDSVADMMNMEAVLDSESTYYIDTAQIVQDSITGAYLIVWVDSLIKGGTYYTDTALQQAIVATATNDSIVSDTSALDSIAQSIHAIDSLLSTYQPIVDSNYYFVDSLQHVNAKLVNDSLMVLSPSLDIETYYKQATNIYLTTIAQDTLFDSSQLATLYTIAFTCPMIGGQAVYRARAMLRLVVDTVYFDDYLCAGHDNNDRMYHLPPSSSDTNRHSEPVSITLYPNPAKDYAVLQAIGNLSGNVQLKITDGTGQTIVNSEIGFISGLYNINTSKFSSGIYYVNLYNGMDKLFGDKLCIFK